MGTTRTLVPNRLTTPEPFITGGRAATKLKPPRQSAETVEEAWSWPWDTFSRTGMPCCECPLPDSRAAIAAVTAAWGRVTVRLIAGGKREIWTPSRETTSISTRESVLGGALGLRNWSSESLSSRSSSESLSSSSSSWRLDWRLWDSRFRFFRHLVRFSVKDKIIGIIQQKIFIKWEKKWKLKLKWVWLELRRRKGKKK